MNLHLENWKNYVTHLECSKTGNRYPHSEVIGLSDNNAPILVKYDLASISKELTKEDLKLRGENLWRYSELLPVKNHENVVSLGENFTPLIPTPNLGKGELFIKDEGRLPTGSF